MNFRLFSSLEMWYFYLAGALLLFAYFYNRMDKVVISYLDDRINKAVIFFIVDCKTRRDLVKAKKSIQSCSKNRVYMLLRTTNKSYGKILHSYGKDRNVLVIDTDNLLASYETLLPYCEQEKFSNIRIFFLYQNTTIPIETLKNLFVWEYCLIGRSSKTSRNELTVKMEGSMIRLDELKSFYERPFRGDLFDHILKIGRVSDVITYNRI